MIAIQLTIMILKLPTIIALSQGYVFPGMRVSRTHIPKDTCFPTHISLGIRVSH